MRDIEGNTLDARVKILREREELKIRSVFCSRALAMADDSRRGRMSASERVAVDVERPRRALSGR